MHAIFIHVLITWCLFNVLSFIVKFSLFIARTIHKIFKLSKFRYFYLKRIYLHVRIPNNVFQQQFRDNWNNIFAIINIHYYKYSQCSSETLRRLCFFFFFSFSSFFQTSATESIEIEIFRIFSRCKIVRFIFRPPFVARRVQWKQRWNTGTRYCQRIFNLQPSTANSNALFSVTFGHKESLSTVINYFTGGKSISLEMEGWKVS